VPIRPEREPAAVVVRVRLLDEQHLAFAREVGALVIERELRDMRVAGSVGEVDVQVAAARREREAEETLFAPEGHPVRQVEDDPRIRTRGERHDPPDLLGDVQRTVAGPNGHRDRLLELRHGDQPYPSIREMRLPRGATGVGRTQRDERGQDDDERPAPPDGR
jgi:hypothetical protein